MSTKIKEKIEANVEAKLRALYQLQLTDSKIDRIRTIRGELPLEVKDLEDVIAGLETRVHNINEKIKDFERVISDRKQSIKDFQANIKKYESQQNKVRNNREYDALTKEIEYQNLEIQIAKKKISEAEEAIKALQENLEKTSKDLEERKKDLEIKKKELDEIVAETEKEENELISESEKLSKNIEPRLLNAYKRIRSNVKNGLAVVTFDRDSCGGCFNKIPPQRQLDIRMYKRIIVCEHCGRILVDGNLIPDAHSEQK